MEQTANLPIVITLLIFMYLLIKGGYDLFNGVSYDNRIIYNDSNDSNNLTNTDLTKIAMVGVVTAILANMIFVNENYVNANLVILIFPFLLPKLTSNRVYVLIYFFVVILYMILFLFNPQAFQ